MTSPATAAIAGSNRSHRPRFASWIGCGLLLSALVAGCASMPDPGGWNSFAEKKAQARFKELCDTQAGEHLYKTVDNVEGYLWVSAWPEIGEHWSKEHTRQLNDQYGLADPYDYCVICLFSSALASFAPAYEFVEIKHTSGKTVRQAKNATPRGLKAPAAVEVAAAQSRYEVTFKTLDTKEDRDLWIGGGRLTITDRQTGEVLGERVGFARGSPGLFHYSDTGPWARTVRCPADPIAYISFTKKVLKPVGAKPQ